MSLALRRTLYFKYALTATYKISPVPTNVREVEYIHQSFSKVAPIEYFSVKPASSTEPNLYRQILTVVFSSWDHASLLNSHNPIGLGHSQSVSHLEQRQEELRKYLLSVCGLPRHSYIEGDDMFMAGRTEIRFKHTLSKDYAGTYTVSPSTVEAPFFTMQSDHDLGEIVPLMRQNFQKIHKLMPLSVRNGIPRHLKPSHSPDIAVNIHGDSSLALPALCDLDHDLSITEPDISSRHFKGFQI